MSTITPITLNANENTLTLNSMMAHFHEHFKLFVANTPELREEVYRIRYKVYCQELGYEREEDCKNGMEQDIYDGRSIHCLLMHTRSGLYAGCVRLVLPAPNQAAESCQGGLPTPVACGGKPSPSAGSPSKLFKTAESCQGGNPPSKLFKTEAGLPFEQVYGHTSESNSPELKNLPRHSFAEVSRLAVTAEFRKRNGEWQYPDGVSAEESEVLENERRHFPLIALGLYLAATSVVMEVGLDGAFTIMQPRLARHLRRFGINFCQVGKLIEFHGQRGLFQISSSSAMNGINANSCELFQMLRTEVKKSLSPSISSFYSTVA